MPGLLAHYNGIVSFKSCLNYVSTVAHYDVVMSNKFDEEFYFLKNIVYIVIYCFLIVL